MISTSILTGKNAPKPGRWLYFDPSEFEALPPEHQDQLFFLDVASSNIVFDAVNNIDILCGDDGWGNKPFSGGCYESVEQFKIQYVEDRQNEGIKLEDGEIWYPITLANESELKKWLYQRGVAFKTEVLVLNTFGPPDPVVLLTTWKMIVKYAETFLSGENALFFDPEISWCMHYHHDDILHFAKGRKYYNKRETQ